MLSHPLTNFEIQSYKNKLKFNDVYSRENLPNKIKIKDEAYVINLDEYADIGTHWIALHAIGNTKAPCDAVTHFDSFGVKHISKNSKNL